MTDLKKEVKEFNILGHNIRLAQSSDKNGVSPDEVVNFVRSEVHRMKQANPNLIDSQLAVLLSLKYASEKIELEREYKENISSFEILAKDAFKLIEEVTPSTH